MCLLNVIVSFGNVTDSFAGAAVGFGARASGLAALFDFAGVVSLARAFFCWQPVSGSNVRKPRAKTSQRCFVVTAVIIKLRKMYFSLGLKAQLLFVRGG